MTTTRRLLRIDFVPPNIRCAKPGCGRPLKQGYIVLEDGLERAYGPECIQSIFSKEAVRQSPDLTRRERQTSHGKRAGTAALRPDEAGEDFETQGLRKFLWVRPFQSEQSARAKIANFCGQPANRPTKLIANCCG